ncbi:Homeobox protein vex1 [Liparis tanakae]|uniref:Homeobox protein vex1 n=1 Tax=Liparis tanakae TaxID=230148 RepID=A0A4Z2F8P3_9TELE|nr:Homeobox protein vex1 [Liparis tanakae]
MEPLMSFSLGSSAAPAPSDSPLPLPRTPLIPIRLFKGTRRGFDGAAGPASGRAGSATPRLGEAARPQEPRPEDRDQDRDPDPDPPPAGLIRRVCRVFTARSNQKVAQSAEEPAATASPPLGRRPRTAFTAEQISSLEKSFKRNAYLGTQDKAELCKKLHLSDKQIRNWFQNRRMKLKRTVQDAMAHACHATVASQFMHHPELQAYRPGPYHRYHESPGPYHRYHEGPAAFAPPPGLQYGAALPGGPALDSFYPYGVMPPPGATTPLLGSYATYPQYY